MAIDTVYFSNTIFQYLYFLGTIALAVIVGKVFAWICKNIFEKQASKTKTEVDNLLIKLLEKPLIFLILIAGLQVGKHFLVMSASFSEFFDGTVSILFILDVAWFIIGIVDVLLIHYIRPLASKTKSDLDDHLLPILRKLMKFIIVVITVVMIIDNFGYNVGSLVAGLGIGGLAFALAAQDVLSNFFGGLAIATDRPFKMNDRIKMYDGTDGWVRDIGLRTTRIETLAGTMLVVPNSILIKNIVENVSKEPARKIKLTLGVEYSTPTKKMEEAKKIIEDVVKKNKSTDDKSLVSFNEFADSSLNFLVIYWVKDIKKLLGVQHEVNMEIKKRFEKAGIEFAFPTRTIYTKKG
ncbi:mechanosensitive ion channel family protein [Nanoarchaeota archaeon]